MTPRRCRLRWRRRIPGHLVLTTLHTMNVVETISRIISFFPPHQHQQIRLLLAGTLKAIVCQRLLPRSDQAGTSAGGGSYDFDRRDS